VHPPDERLTPPPAPGAPRAVRRCLAGWLRVEAAIAVAGLGFAAVTLALDIVGRELLGPLARATGLPLIGALPPGLSRYALYGILLSAFAGFAPPARTWARGWAGCRCRAGSNATAPGWAIC